MTLPETGMLSALDLVRRLESGALTLDGLKAALTERIAAREPEIRALAHFDAVRLRSETPVDGPLRGLPVAFKDIIDTADMPTEYGSPIYAGWRPKADAPIVTMTKQAGGSVLGKAATTEFAFLEPAATLNPHNMARTPGGSSAGSAAGVAAGMMPLAFGTQTGGSVIRPATYCGVAAIKTSFRLLPVVGVKVGAWTLDTMGLFGAGVEDIAFGLEAITGRRMRVDGQDAGAMRFGVCRMAFAGPVAPETERALDTAIAALERAGASVSDVAMPAEFAAGHACHPTIYNYEGGVALAWEIDQHRSQLSTILLDHFAPQPPISLADYDGARGIAKQARRVSRAFFSGFDALITYSAPSPAPDRATTGQASFNRLFTMLGVPCVNVPGLKSPDGMPIGIQVVSGFGQDRRALAAAAFVERALRRNGA